MNAMIASHNAEIRTLMQAVLNGELPEADGVRTIILLQRELITALISHNTHSQTGIVAGLKDESLSLNSEAA